MLPCPFPTRITITPRAPHINLYGLFNAKAILVEEQKSYFLIDKAGKDKAVHSFPKDMSPKVNVIVWLEFEHTTMSQSSMLATILWGLPLFAQSARAVEYAKCISAEG